ncbi:MAG: hypothetical protein HOW73_27380 [Polyangiaceae bacterium]|nr:hypothetical protein [Polyangiaceae bacterium]
MPRMCRIWDIYAKATPQRGSWCAGVTARALGDGSKASWSGGDTKYEGAAARLIHSDPELLLYGVDPNSVIEIFLAIDDDPKKAGTQNAADKVTFQFTAVEVAGGTYYWYQDGDWNLGVNYGFSY